jgi:hypothetical protein
MPCARTRDHDSNLGVGLHLLCSCLGLIRHLLCFGLHTSVRDRERKKAKEKWDARSSKAKKSKDWTTGKHEQNLWGGKVQVQQSIHGTLHAGYFGRCHALITTRPETPCTCQDEA